MTTRKQEAGKDKISREFAARLNGLGPHQKVRAVVMLETGSAVKAGAGRRPAAVRQAAIASMTEAADEALASIDGSLRRCGGQRLAKSANALGAIPVETTVTGISALAASKHVKAILEDQPISLLAS